MTAMRRNSDETQHAEQPFRLVLELKAEGDIPSGTVGPVSGSPPIAFHGWIGLMSAISRLRADLDPARQANDHEVPDDIP
jgi:hypothetical protein